MGRPANPTYYTKTGELALQECSACKSILPVDQFARDKRREGGLNIKCSECNRQSARDHYRDNKEYYKSKDLYRRTLKVFLPHKLGRYGYDTWTRILKRDFDNRCPLTGTKVNVSFEHFIPMSIGHGGTYKGNVWPLDRGLNASKGNRNPFEWIKQPHVREKVNMAGWNSTVRYLAKNNGLTVEEFESFVNWCFANPRQVDQIKADNARGYEFSVDLWRSSVEAR